MGHKKDIAQLYEKVFEIPIEDIIGARIKLKRVSIHYHGLCPFHNDKHLGGFVVTPGKKRWKCFTCGGDVGGDGIQFVSMFEKVSRTEAMLRIALENGLISNSEYGKLSKVPPTTRSTSKPKTEKKKVVVDERPVLDKNLLDKAYSAFICSCKISKADREYLQERGVTGAYKDTFFTFPKRTNDFMDRFKENLQDRGLDTDCLENVPGFYLKNNKWDFMSNEGIGFPIQDRKGRIIGIQIRRKNNDAPRYIWFSSTFACGKKNCMYGIGPGSPIDVVRPMEQKNHVICITEGKFKAIALAQIGLMAVSMQGISNWKSAAETAVDIINKEKWFKNSSKTSIWLCYDADAKINEPVHQSLKNIVAYIKSNNLKYKICVWPITSGKGIDDVINAGKMKDIAKVKSMPLYKRVRSNPNRTYKK